MRNAERFTRICNCLLSSAYDGAEITCRRCCVERALFCRATERAMLSCVRYVNERVAQRRVIQTASTRTIRRCASKSGVVRPSNRGTSRRGRDVGASLFARAHDDIQRQRNAII